jgi:hypothetical protein
MCFVARLVRLAILAAVLSACSGGSNATSRSGSTPSPTSTSSPSSTSQQQETVVIFGDTGNAVTGRLMDGRPFVVRHDPAQGLCLRIGDTAFGGAVSCNDGAPVTLGQGTPRFSAEVQGSRLAYGYLPETATGVVAVFDDGRRVDDVVVSTSAPRVWALHSLWESKSAQRHRSPTWRLTAQRLLRPRSNGRAHICRSALNLCAPNMRIGRHKPNAARRDLSAHLAYLLTERRGLAHQSGGETAVLLHAGDDTAVSTAGSLPTPAAVVC